MCFKSAPLFFVYVDSLEFHFFCFLNLFFNFWYLLGYFLSIFDPKNLSKINQKNVNFLGSILDLFVGGFGALWVPLGSLLGSLEALLGGLRTQKPSKTGGFLRFLKMQLFGSLKLLMVLLGSSCPLFGRSGPKMDPKMVPKRGPKSDQKMVHKIIPNGPKNG